MNRQLIEVFGASMTIYYRIWSKIVQFCMRHSYIGAPQWFGVTFLSMIQETIIDIIQFGNAGTLLLFRLIFSFRRLGISFHSSILYKMTKKHGTVVAMKIKRTIRQRWREKKKLRNEMEK